MVLGANQATKMLESTVADLGGGGGGKGGGISTPCGGEKFFACHAHLRSH